MAVVAAGPGAAVAGKVVPGVLCQYVPELAFAEDQHPVGQLGPGGQREPLRESTVLMNHELAPTLGVVRVPRKYSLRATQVYRREDGEWRVAHRHADTLPDAEGP